MSNIQIVDAEDSLLETKSRDEIDFANDIYRITVLWVVDGDKQPLITKRDVAMLGEKDVWAPSVVGTVVDMETYRTNPLNEIANQLGLDDVQLRAGQKQLFEGERNYFCRWYLAEIPTEPDPETEEPAPVPTPNDEIIDEMKWTSVEELKQDVADNPDNYVSTMNESIAALEEMIAP